MRQMSIFLLSRDFASGKLATEVGYGDVANSSLGGKSFIRSIRELQYVDDICPLADKLIKDVMSYED